MNGGGIFPKKLVKKKESKEELIERMEERGVENIDADGTHQKLKNDFEQYKKKEELIKRMEERGVKNINKNRTHQELKNDFEQHKKEEYSEDKAKEQANTDSYMNR